MTPRKYGWKRDIPDHRDYLYRAGPADPPTEPDCWLWRWLGKGRYPNDVSLRAPGKWPDILDQSYIGSCTANAWVADTACVLAKEGAGLQIFSRLFLYGEERGWTTTDDGATIRDGVKALARVGDCLETSWPYDLARWTERPPPECYAEAAKRRAIVYSRLLTLSDMLHCLASGYPFVFGMPVYESFERVSAGNPVVPMPGPNERMLGGHALAAAGYSRSKGLFLVPNSWGTGWGDRGWCWLPFEYMTKLAADYWTVRFVPTVAAKQ